MSFRKYYKIVFLILIASVTIAANATFFPDIIVTSRDGIWTDTRAFSSLSVAINAIGANERDVYIVRQEAVTILTIPSNVRLHFLKTGSIANTGGLTLQTSKIYGDHQIFTGTGTIDFAIGSTVKSSWFATFDAAVTQTIDDTVTLLVNQAATITSNIALGNNVSLRWDGANLLSVANTKTLSNIGSITAPNVQLFAGLGTFSFRDGNTYQLSWFPHLYSAVSWLSATKASIIFTGAHAADYDITIPSNISSKSAGPGSILTIANSKLLTFNGALEAGNHQIFNCLGIGRVVLGAKASVDALANWWGLVGDNSTANAAPLQAAITAVADGGKLTILSDRATGWAEYLYNTTLTGAVGINLVFGKGVKLVYSGTGNGLAITGTTTGAEWLIEESVIITSTANPAGQTGAGIKVSACPKIRIKRPTIEGFFNGIKVDANSATASCVYGIIDWPNIRCNTAVSGGSGIHLTGDPVTSGRRPNGWTINGGSIWGADVAGYGIKIDCGSGLVVDGCFLEVNSGWGMYLGEPTKAYRLDNCRIKNCWFEGNTLGSIYFDIYAVNNYIHSNNYRGSTDRKMGGPWVNWNILQPEVQPSATGVANYGRNLYTFNNTVGQNILFNSAFMIVDPEYSGVPLGWTKLGIAGSPAWEIKTDTPPDGFDQYTRITSAVGGSGPRIYRYENIKPGRLYYVGGWIRTDTSAKASIRVGDPDNDNCYAEMFNTTGTVNTWEFVSTTFMVPHKGAAGAEVPPNRPNGNVLQINLRNNSVTPDVSNCDFAGIMVVQGGIGADYSEHPDTHWTTLRHNFGSVYTQSIAGADLRTITLAAKQFNFRGILEIEWAGQVTGTHDTKTVALKWGSNTLCTLSFIAADQQEWLVRVRVEGVSATGQRVTVLEVKGATDPIFFTGAGANLYQGVTQDPAAAIAITATGTVANALDYVYLYSCTVKPITPWFDTSRGGL